MIALASPVAINSPRVANTTPSLTRRFLGALIFLFFIAITFTIPVKDAHAMTAYQALDTVCKEVKGLCGNAQQYGAVYKACFENADEIGCALGIIQAASGNASSEAQKVVTAITGCVKAGPPISATCEELLNATGLPAGKVNEAYTILKRCVNADDVDDVIVCADLLIDSSFVDDAELKIPTWVDFLFDIYMDIRDEDYWSLVYHVGATVACAVAQYFTGNDVCAFLEDLYEVGKSIVNAAGEIIDFISDLFSSGGTHFYVNGKEVNSTEYIVAKYGNADNPGGAVASLKERIAGEKVWQAHRAKIIKTEIDFWTGFFKFDYSKPPNDEGFNKAWVIYEQRSVYPLWDQHIRQNVIQQRKAAIDKATAAITQDKIDALIAEKDDGKRGTALMFANLGCVAAAAAYNPQMEEWTKAGRPGAGEAVGEPGATCQFRTAQRLLAGSGVNSCEQKVDISSESISARCKTAPAMELCLSAKKTFSDKRVSACTLGDAAQEKQGAQASFTDFGKFLKTKDVRCIWGVLYNDANAMHCQDALYTEQCTAEMKAQYGKTLGWPKAGVAECKTVVSDVRKKAIAAAAKIADMLPTTINLHGVGGAGALKAGNGTVKSGFCSVDKNDAVVVRCTGINFPLTRERVENINKAIAPIKAQSCSAAEADTSPKKHWLDEPCVVTDGARFMENYVVGTVPQTIPGKNVVIAPPNVTQVVPPVAGKSSTTSTATAPGAGATTMAKPPMTAVVPLVSQVVITGSTPLGGSAAPAGNVLKPGGFGLSAPVPSTPKVDEAALKTCKPFRDRKDEMLCSDARSFAACKTAVDIGQMKTCRLTGSTDVYSKR